MRTLSKEELKESINQHLLWLNNKGGERLVLINYDLRGNDLSDSDLSGSNLSDSDLSGSNLSNSDLRGSDLRLSALSDSNLSGSNFSNSDLRWSDLSGSNLSNSNLGYSNLGGSDLENTHVSRLYGHPWEITVYPESLAIGCERHTIEEWERFTEKEIGMMDRQALAWWAKWQDSILSYATLVQTN